MSVYNIVRKRKVLETNLKSEEITNFYPMFWYGFILVEYRNEKYVTDPALFTALKGCGVIKLQ